MKKLMKGNEAIAEAAVQAGCKFFFGYPITPQNEIPEYMSRRMPKVGGCYLQAESEVSAINMVYGAGGAGARVMTSSSSPGISLKQEGISYLVGAEVPCVIVNMMRGGPGLGGIQPAQSDYYQATRGGGHGDYRTCVLAPASVQEAVDLTQTAFDIADRYRNPVMVLGDGMIGQMMEPVDMDNGYHPAVDLAEKTWAANGHVATPGRPRNITNSLYIDPKVLERHCERLESKYKQITEKECRWQEEMLKDAEVVVVAYGTTSRIVRSAIRKCREQGIKVGMLRPITLWPFPTEAIRKTLDTAKHYLTVEMSAGQMVDDVRLAVDGKRPVHFYGRMGGMVPTVAEVVEQIKRYAEPSPQNAKQMEMDHIIDEKLKAVTSAVQHILSKARKTIFETKLFSTHSPVNAGTDAQAKEAAKVFDEHSFDEIEAKFKSALNQMKLKLKEASDTLQETSSADMEQKVKEAAETMAQRIQEAALKMEEKLEQSGIKGKAAKQEQESAAETVAQAFETAAETMEQAAEKAADELDAAVEAATAPAEEAAQAMQETAETAEQTTEEAAETVEEAVDEAEEATEKAGESLDGQVRQAMDKLDEKMNAAADKLEETLEAAGKKIDDMSADDVEEKLTAAAKAVEEKLSEAGRKIEEFFNDPDLQKKADDAGAHVNAFFDRAGKSIASGIDGFLKTITRAAENAKRDLNDQGTKADEPQDKEDE